MTRDDIIRMARKAGLINDCDGVYFRDQDSFEHFAALVAAAEREKVASWMMKRGYSTGHGETTEDLLQELDWQIVDNWTRAMMNGVTTEREMCAKVADAYDVAEDVCSSDTAEGIAIAIRARGQS